MARICLTHHTAASITPARRRLPAPVAATCPRMSAPVVWTLALQLRSGTVAECPACDPPRRAWAEQHPAFDSHHVPLHVSVGSSLENSGWLNILDMAVSVLSLYSVCSYIAGTYTRTDKLGIYDFREVWRACPGRARCSLLRQSAPACGPALWAAYPASPTCPAHTLAPTNLCRPTLSWASSLPATGSSGAGSPRPGGLQAMQLVGDGLIYSCIPTQLKRA